MLRIHLSHCSGGTVCKRAYVVYWVGRKCGISISLFFKLCTNTAGRGAYATGPATSTGTVSGTTGGRGLTRLDSDPHNLRSAGEFVLSLIRLTCFMCTYFVFLFEPPAVRSLKSVAFREFMVQLVSK